jgi:hypothetical protein
MSIAEESRRGSGRFPPPRSQMGRGWSAGYLVGAARLPAVGHGTRLREAYIRHTTTVLTLTVTGLVADTTSQISARSATDLSPGGARGCANGRCLVALGRPRRPALVGGSTAGRLCRRRLRGDEPPTIAGLAVARRPSPARQGHGDPTCCQSLSVTAVRVVAKPLRWAQQPLPFGDEIRSRLNEDGVNYDPSDPCPLRYPCWSRMRLSALVQHRRLSTRVRQAKSVMVPGAGHVAYLEQPALYSGSYRPALPLPTTDVNDHP